MVYWYFRLLVDLFESNTLALLFYRLHHDFEAGDGCPDHENQSGFRNLEDIKPEGSETAKSYEYRLAKARIHRRELYISSVIDLFYKKNKEREETWAREKDRNSHQRKSEWHTAFRVHKIHEQGCRRKTRNQNYEKDKCIESNRHLDKALTKWYNEIIIYKSPEYERFFLRIS